MAFFRYSEGLVAETGFSPSDFSGCHSPTSTTKMGSDLPGDVFDRAGFQSRPGN
jgi:hypothetical protein